MEVRTPEHWSGQAKHLAEAVWGAPFHKRSWAELAYFLASSALCCLAVGVVVVLGALGSVLTAAFFGIFLLAGGLRLARRVGGWQRALARRALGEQVLEPEPFSARPGLFRWLRAALADRVAWRAFAYLVAKVPLTLLGVWLALSVWLEAVTALASPVVGGSGLGGFGPFGRLFVAGGPATGPVGAGAHLGIFLTGVVLLLIAPWPMRLVVSADRQLMHFFLGPDAAASRLRRLEQSRSRTLDVATETLRRIERDLHDGTQAQLVALAMRLGQANEKLSALADGEGREELEAVRALVDQAHRGAKEAITDLRDLARGIHPPALDTGLENALATLAARSPVPTEVSVAVERRPAPFLEAICYFCAAELLANVAQHARATRAFLSCAQHGPWLRIVVRDDGRGGAVVKDAGSSSSGLAGLRERVGVVDGHLSVVSPPGGPTAITIDLPAKV